MSTFSKQTKHPVTGEWLVARWVDDYFGNHNYGVQFEGDDKTYDPREIEFETKAWE